MSLIQVLSNVPSFNTISNQKFREFGSHFRFSAVEWSKFWNFAGQNKGLFVGLTEVEKVNIWNGKVNIDVLIFGPRNNISITFSKREKTNSKITAVVIFPDAKLQTSS